MGRLYSILNGLKTKDIIITLIILSLPFLFYLYKIIPITPIWETDWFILNSGKWEDVKFLLWVLSFKLLVLSILIIWFITCSHWWRYVILVPMIIELFKLRSIFDNTSDYIDEIEFLQSLPLTVPVILFVFLLSKKLGYFSNYKSLREEINQEIEQLLYELNIIKQKDLIKLKGEFNKIKRDKSKMTTNQYNKKLVELRKELIEKL